MKAIQTPRQLSRRDLILSAVGATLGAAMLVSVAESLYSNLPGAAVMGLYVPVALLVALGLLFSARLFGGAELPEVGALFQYRARRFRVLLGALSVPLTLLILGRLALGFFGELEERPVVAGALLASSTVGIFTFMSWAVEKCARALCARFPAPTVSVTVLISGGIFACSMSTLVYLGDPGGVGDFFSLFGVFKREELNLIPLLSLISIIGIGGGAFALLKQRPKLNVTIASTLVALAFYCAAQALYLDFQSALAFERSSGMSRLSLSYHQILFDEDHDGFSPYYGGEDCDDNDPGIFPGAIEVRGDGIDQDCQNGDLKKKLPVVKAAPIEEPKSMSLKSQLNVLLLTIDTLRFDLGFSGEPNSSSTPVIDEFAKLSTVFERAYSLASYTSKSLGPMMIGLYPSETARSFEHFDRFKKSMPFIAERVEGAGLKTLSVQGYWYFFRKSYGFERGFQTLNHEAAPRLITIEGDNSFNGDRVATELIEELGKVKEERFFAWAHWVDPHAQYVRHEDFDFGDSPKQRYDSEVAFVDAQFGRIIDYLKLEKLLENTVIIITSDHGEAFGEHGMTRHGFELWEELIRVPLLLYVPGASAQRIKERRSLIDIAPTILDALEVKLLDTEVPLQGQSLISEALGARGDKRPVLIDMPKGPHNQERRAFIQDDIKLTTSSGRVIGLYDLSKDAGEKSNLKSDKDLLAVIKAQKEEFITRLNPISAR